MEGVHSLSYFSCFPVKWKDVVAFAVDMSLRLGLPDTPGNVACVTSTPISVDHTQLKHLDEADLNEPTNVSYVESALCFLMRKGYRVSDHSIGLSGHFIR